MALPIAASTLFGSMGQATSLFTGLAELRAGSSSMLRAGDRALIPGNYLAEDYDVEAYYLRDRRCPGSGGQAPTTSG